MLLSSVKLVELVSAMVVQPIPFASVSSLSGHSWQSIDILKLDNTEYALCKDEIRRDLITATAGVSALASFLMVGSQATLLYTFIANGHYTGFVR